MLFQKSIWNIIAATTLTVAALGAISLDSAMGWTATVFFGSITLLLINRYFKTYNTAKGKGKQFYQDAVNSPGQTDISPEGIFQYNERGFIVKLEEVEQSIHWKQVKCMVAYKLDRFASDDICLDIIYGQDSRFTIFEETPGWENFVDKSKQALPGIDHFWDIEITTPIIEGNATLVYDWKGRSLEEIEKEYY